MAGGDEGTRDQVTAEKPAAWHWTARDSLIVAGLTVAAFLLRLFRLDYRDLWTDEYITIYKIQLPFREMVEYCVQVGHTPVYFAFLQAWAMVAGTTDWALRFPAAVAGALLIPATALFARHYVTRRFLMILLGWVCLGSFLVWSSQEARMYSMLALVATISHLAYLRTLETSTLPCWAVYFACLMVGTMLHPLMVIFYFGHLAFSVVQVRKYPAHARVALSIGALVIIAGVIAALATNLLDRRLHEEGIVFTRPVAVLRRLGQLALGEESVLPLYRRVITVLLAIAAVGGCIGWLRIRRKGNPGGRFAAERLFIQFCAAAVIVPTLLIWFVSFFLEEILNATRYLIPAAVPLIALIIWCITQLPPLARQLTAVAFAAVILIGLGTHYNNPGTGGREMIRLLYSLAEEGDIVISQRPLTDPVAFDHYGGPSVNLRVSFVMPRIDTDEGVEGLRAAFQDRSEAWVYIYRAKRINMETFIETAPDQFEVLRAESLRRAKLFRVRLLEAAPADDVKADSPRPARTIGPHDEF